MTDWYMVDLESQSHLHDDEMFNYWLDRKQAHALKIAVVLQLLATPGDRVLQVDFARQAMQFVDYLDRGTRVVYDALSVSKDAEHISAIEMYLRRKGRPVPQRKVFARFKNQYPRPVIREGLVSLQAAGVCACDDADVASGDKMWRVVR